MSYSAIFQLYSDRTVVQFPNLDLQPGTHAMSSSGSFKCRAYSNTGTRTSKGVFNLLAITGPAHGEGMLGIEPKSLDPQSCLLPLRRCDGLFCRKLVTGRLSVNMYCHIMDPLSSQNQVWQEQERPSVLITIRFTKCMKDMLTDGCMLWQNHIPSAKRILYTGKISPFYFHPFRPLTWGWI